MNVEELLERCLDRIDLMERVIEKYEARFDDDLEELFRWHAAGDTEALAHTAHRMKGAAATVAARFLTTTLADIEDAARAEEFDRIMPRLAQLRDQWQQFHAFTVSLLARTRET